MQVRQMYDKQILQGRALIGLLGYALGFRSADEVQIGADVDAIMDMARTHDVLVMAWDALNRLRHLPPDKANAWEAQARAATRTSAIQHLELIGLCRMFSQESIPMIPLKGSVLKALYPRIEYRQMSDLDLLVAPENIKKAREVMHRAGYAPEEIGQFHRDSYIKPPVMNIELHHRLLPDEQIDAKIFGDIWKRAVPSTENDGCWRMSGEDFYIFMLMHFAKHYKFRGSGIRPIIDIAVFLRNCGRELDGEYISRAIDAAGLANFKRTAERLADIWFGDGCHDRQTRIMEINLICSGGVHGSDRQYMRNHLMWVGAIDRPLEKIYTKLRFLLWRMFPPLRTMRIRYPVLRRMPALIPIFWIYRMGYAIACTGVKTIRELAGILKA